MLTHSYPLRFKSKPGLISQVVTIDLAFITPVVDGSISHTKSSRCVECGDLDVLPIGGSCLMIIWSRFCGEIRGGEDASDHRNTCIRLSEPYHRVPGTFATGGQTYDRHERSVLSRFSCDRFGGCRRIVHPVATVSQQHTDWPVRHVLFLSYCDTSKLLQLRAVVGNIQRRELAQVYNREIPGVLDGQLVGLIDLSFGIFQFICELLVNTVDVTEIAEESMVARS